MKFTKEQIEKAKAAKSVEELLTLAKENGMELTEEEAAKHFAEWHKEDELADDELDNVVGGCGNPDPVFSVGSIVCIGLQSHEVIEILEYNEYRGYLYKCKSIEGSDYGVVYELYEDQLK